MTSRSPLKTLVAVALFAAMTTVTTAYILHIPFPGGYVHPGDVFIYLCACLLPTPYAVAAGAIGGGLADLLTYPSWALPTLVIKGVVAACFSNRTETIFCPRNLIGVGLATLISPTLYGLAQAGMAGTWAAFPVQFAGTLVQGLFSGVLFLILAPALDRARLKERLKL